MSRSLIIAISLIGMLIPGSLFAQGNENGDPRYSQEVLEEYWNCMERNDLKEIQDLLWYHKNVERIDASIYGLPSDDFDDSSLLTIEERLRYRQSRSDRLAADRSDALMATRGSIQYPHHLRGALDHHYAISGLRPDCSGILGGGGPPPTPAKAVGSSWGADLNLTTFDGSSRGEVDIVIDYANPNRIMASSVPSGGSPDSSSDLITSSTDWGQTWDVLTQVGNNAGTTWECDPVSYYQRSTGKVFHSKIGCTSGTCGTTWLGMRSSTDNGATWTDCARPDNGGSEDRQWHVVDNTLQYDSDSDGIVDTANACYGTVHVTWHNSNQEKVTSTNNGTHDCSSWRTVTNLTGTSSAITPDINVAADGHAYVVWQNFADATFKIAGSNDCGASWTSPSATTIKARLGDWKNNIPAQCQRGISTLPTVDVDRCPWSENYGRVYVSMFDFDQAGCGSGPGCSTWNDGCDYDVWFAYSDDQGSTWSSPLNIARDVLNHGDNVDSFMGYMRVDESDGSIYVGYHRTRLNPTSLTDRQKTHYFVARSTDGGTTWTETQISTLEGDERLSGASTFERGDYNRIDTFEGVFYPLWIDRRNSAGEEELVTRKMCTEPAHKQERLQIGTPDLTPPGLNMTSPGAGTADIAWTAPDAHWGDGGENNAVRKYQLWVDGALAQDNILWTDTSISGYDPGDCNSHNYMIRAINQCSVSKDYATTAFSATGCCANNPTQVDVTPNGPLTLCAGASQGLTATDVNGDGSNPLTYQWYEDGAPVGTDSSSYTATSSGTKAYNCEITGNGCAGGTKDPLDIDITWQAAPIFAGITSATNGSLDNPCTIDLQWNQATTVCPNPIRYNIYRDVTPGFTPGGGNQIATNISCAGSPCNYADSDSLVYTTDYYYVVRAYNSVTLAEDTNLVEATATPTGSTPVPSTAYADDFDGNRPASPADYWIEATFGGDDNGADELALNTSRFRSTTTSYKFGGTGTGNYTRTEDNALILGGDGSGVSNGFAIPADAINVRLNFYHTYEMEAGWDGAHLLFSTTNWSSGYSAVGDVPVGGSPYLSSGGYTGVLGDGTAAWNGNTIATFSQSVVNADALAGSTVWFLWRFFSDGTTQQEGYYLDDVSIVWEIPGTCVTSSSCSNPSAPSISLITDDSDCAQSGVTITYSNGTGATSHDLYMDGGLAQAGVSSPISFDPGDTASHNYVIRAIDGACSTDSTPDYAFTDADSTLVMGGAPTVNDADGCALTGVDITWSAVGGATSYDLFVDGVTTVTGVTSPHTYSPGDSASHNYQLRANNATCTGTWSATTASTDAAGIVAPANPTVTDVSACAISGLQITWTGVAGATGYDIRVDGGTIISGVTSPYTHTPGAGSHNYEVRGTNGVCLGAWSGVGAASDDDHSFSFTGINGAADRDACDDTGVNTLWNTSVTWNDAAGPGSRSFHVERSGADVSGALATTISQFIDLGGTNSVIYNYAAVATNAYSCTSGAGSTLPASDEVGSAPTFAGLQSVTIMDNGVCGLRLDWNAGTSKCVLGPFLTYSVYRSTLPGFLPSNANRIASCVPDLFYEDTSVAGNTTYYYVVRAEDSSSGHGGFCNDGFEDSNSVELNQILAGSSEVRNQDGAKDPLTANSSNDTADFTPAFASISPALASVAYNLAHGGLASTLTYTYTPVPSTITKNAPTLFSQTVTENNTVTNVVIDVAAAAPTRTGSNLLVELVHGATTVTVYNGLATGWASSTFTFPTEFDAAASIGTWTLQFTPSGGTGGPADGSLTNWVLKIGSGSLGDPNTCIRVELLDPLAAATILKNYNEANAASYNVLAYYTIPGTYSLRMTENCGGDATLDSGVMTVSAAACTATSSGPVQSLTARSGDGTIKVEWQNPSGTYGYTRTCVSTSAFPTDPATCTNTDKTGSAGSYDWTTASSLTNGTTYFYSAWVYDGISEWSSRKTVQATPFSTASAEKWRYVSGASSVQAVGLTPGGIGAGAVFSSSNDRMLHGSNPTTAGGDWPRTAPYNWMPSSMNGPAQHRPSVVALAAGARVFLASLDGYAYCFSAQDGSQIWSSAAQLGDNLLSTPSAFFSEYVVGVPDLIFYGTRNTAGANTLHALNHSDGSASAAFTFTNTVAQGGDNTDIGIITGTAVDYATQRVIFTSRANAAGSQNTVWVVDVSGASATLVWAAAIGDIDGGPNYVGSAVYVGTNDGRVFSLDLGTGATNWTFVTSDGAIKEWVYTDRTLTPVRVYVATDNKVWALEDNTNSVAELWQISSISGPSLPVARLGTNDIYVGGGNGVLYKISAATGAQTGSVTLGGAGDAIGSPTIDTTNNMAVVGSTNGVYHAIDLGSL